MHERVVRLPGALSRVNDDGLVREFEACLADTSTLAFRVAYSVLRQREEAEDVAQDAFVQAYRRFSQLRDRTRFRAWLVRLTFRLALDRQRAARRRSSREVEPLPEGVPSIAAIPGPDFAPILLMSHLDVVDAPDALFEPVEKDGKLFGRGSFDDKYAAALSMILFRDHLRKARQQGRGQKTWLWAS